LSFLLHGGAPSPCGAAAGWRPRRAQLCRWNFGSGVPPCGAGTQAGNPCAPQELGNTTPGAPSGAGPGAPECGASPTAANDPSRAATDPATSPATGTTTGAAGSSPGTERAATGAPAAQTAGGRRSQSTGCPTAPDPAGFALGGTDPASAGWTVGRSHDRASVNGPTTGQSAGRSEWAPGRLTGRGQRGAKGPSGSARVSGGFPNEPATRRRSPPPVAPGVTAGDLPYRGAPPQAGQPGGARPAAAGSLPVAPTFPPAQTIQGPSGGTPRRSGSSPGAAKARWVFAARSPARDRPSGYRTFASGANRSRWMRRPPWPHAVPGALSISAARAPMALAP
jgi:hypothetical protein